MVITLHEIVARAAYLDHVKMNSFNNNNNVHLSCAHQHPACSHDTY